MQLIPYLNFPGTCREAFRLYARVLGGRITAEIPLAETPFGAGSANSGLIAHVRLEAAAAVLMGSDCPQQEAPGRGGAVTVNVQVDSVGEAERIFAALAQGAEVHMPLAETSWAQRFGTLTDRYGVAWMVNCPRECPGEVEAARTGAQVPA